MALSLYQNTIQGRVAIGEKHQERGYPVPLDYFVFTKPFDQKAKIAPKFPAMTAEMTKIYGTSKPKSIKVVFVDNHPDEVFYSDYMNYPNSNCNCRGNGEKAMRVINDLVEKKEVVCDYDNCQFRLAKTPKGIVNTCKPTGIMTFMIPEAPVSGGVWKFTTHGMMTISKIAGALRNIYRYRHTLFGLQANLKIVVVSVKVNGKPTNVTTVECEVDYSWNEIASGSGTSIGTLMEAQAKHLFNGAANPERMKELSNSSSGYDGSMENAVVVKDDSNPEPITIDVDPLDDDQPQSDGFSF